MGVRIRRVLILSIIIVLASALVVSNWNRRTREGDQASDVERVTADIERRPLTTSLRLPGTFVQERTITVATDAFGDPEGPQFLTKSPPDPGTTIKPGDVIAEVNYRPVVLVAASLPFYRQIRPGDSGGDVDTLQEGLRSMGYAIPESESGTFGSESEAAIEDVYGAAGYEPPFTQGTRDATDATVKAAWKAADDAYEEANAARSRGEEAGELVRAYEEAQAHARATEASEGVVLDPSEVVAVPNRELVVGLAGVRAGQPTPPQTVLTTLSDGAVVIHAAISPTQAALLNESSSVEILGQSDCSLGEPMPASAATDPGEDLDDSTEPSPDTPAESGDAADSSMNGDLVVPVACSPSPDLTLVGTDTTVSVISELAGDDSLVVPATALVYSADGTASVIVIDGGREDRVPVAVVDEADGYVAIASGHRSISEGASVVVQT